MTGRQNPKLEELKRRAVELRLQGIRAKAIAEILDSGHSPWTIRQWLQKAKLPSTQERVLKLASTLSTDEIALKLRISKRRVQWILQDVGASSRKRRTTEQNVDLFLARPQEYMNARFTQSWPFGWALLQRCVREVDKAPIPGLPTVRLSAKLLDRIRSTRRRDSTKRRALCLFLLCRGIEAHVYTVTNRQLAAMEVLTQSHERAVGCISCEADQLRRLGFWYYSRKHWDSAYSSLNGALDRYNQLGNSGHDLHGNGVANCLLLKCQMQYFTVSPEAGAAVAREALRIMNGSGSPVLFGNLVFALAKCLQPSTDIRQVQASQELLDWCLENMQLAKELSVSRAMIYWLRGLLASARGLVDEAEEDLSLALEDAKALKREQDVASIVADLGALNPDPREIRNHIEDFCDWDDAGNLIVPPWCPNLDAEIRSVYEVALQSRARMDASIFSNLRKAAGGENRMPAFMIPSLMAGAEAQKGAR